MCSHVHLYYKCSCFFSFEIFHHKKCICPHVLPSQVVIISDVFSTSGQFDWMLVMFLEQLNISSHDDVITYSALIYGLLKSSAVGRIVSVPYTNTSLAGCMYVYVCVISRMYVCVCVIHQMYIHMCMCHFTRCMYVCTYVYVSFHQMYVRMYVGVCVISPDVCTCMYVSFHLFEYCGMICVYMYKTCVYITVKYNTMQLTTTEYNET